MINAFAVTLVFLIGCSWLPPGTEPLPAEDYRMVFAVWLERGYPPGRCTQYDEEGDVLVVIVDDTWELCYGDVNGCMTSTDEGVFGSGGWYPLIVQHRDYAGPELIAHELTHWFARCGQVRGGDHAHLAPGLWGNDGVESAIAAVMEGGSDAESRRSP